MRPSTPEPAHRDDRNPGRFERLLGHEPVRTYVPLMLTPWVMECTHREAVHLGEKVTENILQIYYWLIGIADSVKWWIRRCCTYQARKTARKTIGRPLVCSPLPTRPGQMISFNLLGPLPETGRGDTHMLLILIVDIFSRHAEGYAMTKEENCSRL